jgi:hypothetical protein
MPPTFNFLAGNQEAEENKALKKIIDQSPRAAPFRGRTYRADGTRDSQVLQRRPKLEGLGTHINKQTRSAEVHVDLPKRSSKQLSQPKDEPNI